MTDSWEKLRKDAREIWNAGVVVREYIYRYIKKYFMVLVVQNF